MATTVDVELSLLVDVSGSVNDDEYKLQIEGYAKAFEDPTLYNNVISKGLNGKVAVNFVVWSGAGEQQESVVWTEINSVASSQAFAAAIRSALLPANGGSRPFFGLTAPGSAIAYADDTFFTNNFNGTYQVIDVSGDGVKIDGIDTATARNTALTKGVDVINGLYIDPANDPGLANFYQTQVIGGTNPNNLPAKAFEAKTFQEFDEVIELKLKTENATVPILSINDVAVLEGNNGTKNLTFTVSLAGNSLNPITVKYDTVNNTALAGSDYTATNGTLTFNPGQTSKTISVPILGDTTVEPDETFFLKLSNSVNAAIIDEEGVGTILNDDTNASNAIVTLSATRDLVVEDGANLVYTFKRTGDLSSPLTANFSVGGTAQLGSDYTVIGTSNYTATSGSVTFAAGKDKAEVQLKPVNDTVAESRETAILTLTSGSYVVGTFNPAVGTIMNEDGSAGNDILEGGPKSDLLQGLGGDDILIGYVNTASGDTLVGGSGKDRFVYNHRNQGNDSILDFNVADDTIVVNPNFQGGLVNEKTITAAQLVIGTSFTNSSQRFLYNSGTGQLTFDPDGNGALGSFNIAKLSTGLALTNADILVSNGYVY